VATTPFPVTSAGFWRGYAITLRPYLSFVSGAAGLVGLALTGLEFPPFCAAFLAFFFSYGLGQALTDVFQRDTDGLSSPYRPLVRGELAPGAVIGVSLSGLAACAGVFFLLDSRTLALTAAAVVGATTRRQAAVVERALGNAWIVACPRSACSAGAVAAPGAAWRGVRQRLVPYAVFVLPLLQGHRGRPRHRLPYAAVRSAGPRPGRERRVLGLAASHRPLVLTPRSRSTFPSGRSRSRSGPLASPCSSWPTCAWRACGATTKPTQA
jgi:hypothetical protein